MGQYAGPITFIFTIIFGIACFCSGYKWGKNSMNKHQEKEKLDDVKLVEETEHFLSA